MPSKVQHPLIQRAACEGVGTAILLAGIVGSGITAERLSGGNIAIALLANALATGGVLFAMILAFGSFSGAHLNPAVSLSDALRGGLQWNEALTYIFAQITGAVVGVAVAHVMFGEPVFFVSHHSRHGFPQIFSEFVATFGLLVVIWSCVRYRSNATPSAVAAYIIGAYWFTASTSFANPAVTIARSMSNTFAGIAPRDVPWFILAQLAGAFAATLFFRWLVPIQNVAKDAAISHAAIL